MKKTKNEKLKAVFRFKKRKGDNAIPTTTTELINRYNATVARPDLSLGAYLIDARHELINGVMVLLKQSTSVHGFVVKTN